MPDKKKKNWATKLYQSVLPQKIELMPEVTKILTQIYPTLDFSKIYFFDGMPWFMKHGFAIGVTLPGTYNMRGINIYMKDFDINSEAGFATLVHEVFHALQYKDLNNAYGLGFMRSFMIYYLADYFRLCITYLRPLGWQRASYRAYELHPMELPAYELEYEFRYCYKVLGLGTGEELVPASCIRETSGYKYSGSYLYVVLGFLITLLFMLIKPFIEFFILLIVPFVKILEIVNSRLQIFKN